MSAAGGAGNAEGTGDAGDTGAAGDVGGVGDVGDVGDVGGTGDAGDAGDATSGELTHLDVRGHARMVDVGAKDVTARSAQASARVLMSPETAGKLLAGDLPKGDALPVARIAGIQAAKRTPDLIPLCHHIALSSVTIDIEVDAATGVVEVQATAKATDRTGVEMEALTAATVASLTLYDLVKAVQRDVVITDVRLVAKSGGRSGDYRAP